MCIFTARNRGSLGDQRMKDRERSQGHGRDSSGNPARIEGPVRRSRFDPTSRELRGPFGAIDPLPKMLTDGPITGPPMSPISASRAGTNRDGWDHPRRMTRRVISGPFGRSTGPAKMTTRSPLRKGPIRVRVAVEDDPSGGAGRSRRAGAPETRWGGEPSRSSCTEGPLQTR